MKKYYHSFSEMAKALVQIGRYESIIVAKSTLSKMNKKEPFPIIEVTIQVEGEEHVIDFYETPEKYIEND